MVRRAARTYIARMQAAQRRLDELVLGVLAPEEQPSSAASFASIEVCDEEDLSTTQFVRYSSPYDKVDIEPLAESAPRVRVKTTTFAPTVQVFDPAWFDRDAEPADDAPAPPRATWWWLIVSLAVAACAVVTLAAVA